MVPVIDSRRLVCLYKFVDSNGEPLWLGLSHFCYKLERSSVDKMGQPQLGLGSN